MERNDLYARDEYWERARLEAVETARRRARKGAFLMDQALPDWRANINRGDFRISHGDKCILGQCFKSFDKGCDALIGAARANLITHFDDDNVHEFGFTVLGSADAFEPTFDDLQKAWDEILDEG